MMHVYDPSHILLLNSASVICMTNPSDPVIEQYLNHIESYRKEAREKQSQTDDFLDRMEEEDEQKDDRIVKFKPKLH
jgi:hypothetical protein